MSRNVSTSNTWNVYSSESEPSWTLKIQLKLQADDFMIHDFHHDFHHIFGSGGWSHDFQVCFWSKRHEEETEVAQDHGENVSWDDHLRDERPECPSPPTESGHRGHRQKNLHSNPKEISKCDTHWLILYHYHSMYICIIIWYVYRVYIYIYNIVKRIQHTNCRRETIICWTRNPLSTFHRVINGNMGEITKWSCRRTAMAAMGYGWLWDLGVPHGHSNFNVYPLPACLSPRSRWHFLMFPHLWDPMIFTWPALHLQDFASMFVFQKQTYSLINLPRTYSTTISSFAIFPSYQDHTFPQITSPAQSLKGCAAQAP